MARGRVNPRLGARLAAALGAALVLGMAAVAMNAAQGTALAGYGPAKPEWLLLAIGIVIVGWTVSLRLRRSQDRLPAGGTPTQARIASLVVPGIVVMALGTVVGLALLGTHGLQTPPIQQPPGIAAPSAPPQGQQQPTPVPTSGTGGQGSSSPLNFQQLLIGFLVLLAAALLVVVIVLLARWLNARRRAGAGGQGSVDGGLTESDRTGEALADAVHAGRQALADDPDPRTAIIACYAAMERSLAHGGISRRKADTPTELLQRAAEADLVRGDSAHALTELFREARYSTHPMGEAQRDRARAALESIGAHLAAAAAEADARFGAREETLI